MDVTRNNLVHFVMETSKKPARKESQAAKKRRSQVDKVGRRKWIIQLLHRLDRKIDRIDRRTRFLAAGLREWLKLSSDYVTMIACEDELDVKILWALQGVGMSTTELAKELDIDRWTALRRIQRMNKRFHRELNRSIAEKRGHKWILISALQDIWAATKEKIEQGNS